MPPSSRRADHRRFSGRARGALAAVLVLLGLTLLGLARSASVGHAPPPPKLTAAAPSTAAAASTIASPTSSPRHATRPRRAAGSSGSTTGSAGSVPALPASPPVRLTIPAISVDAALVRLGLAGDGSMEVPATAAQAGWFTGSPTPGSTGPAVLVGHVTYNGPGVFFRLGQLRPHNRIRITRRDGRVAVFAVTAVQQYPKSTFPTAIVYGQTSGPELRLITCSGDYDTSRHHYADDLVVFARLLPT